MRDIDSSRIVGERLRGRHNGRPRLLSVSRIGAFCEGDQFIGVVVNESRAKSDRIVDDATCLGCPCLCDDIGLVVKDDRIVEEKNACSVGRDWYAGLEDCPEEPPTISGQPVSLEAALDRAAEILGAARAPVVVGPDGSTIEANRVLIAIADRIGAFVENKGREPLARVGRVGATLGEIKNRADVIVYAGSPLATLWPRFRERYAEDSPGRFIPEGRAGRTVIRLGNNLHTFEPDRPPDLAIDFDQSRSAAVYATLRAIVKGVAMESSAVERSTSVPLATLIDVSGLLKRARYGAFVYGWQTASCAESEAFYALVAELNAWTRFVAIAPEQDVEPETVRTWQAGFGDNLDLSLGSPRLLTREGLSQRVRSGEVDAAFVVGQTYLLSESFHMKMRFPEVVVRPGRTGRRPSLEDPDDLCYPSGYEGDVCIPTAAPGIDEAGTVARFDGVMLPLRPPFARRRVTQVDVLRGIEARLKERAR
jgi:formylmethanofuran dehydrogenase subunit B